MIWEKRLPELQDNHCCMLYRYLLQLAEEFVFKIAEPTFLRADRLAHGFLWFSDHRWQYTTFQGRLEMTVQEYMAIYASFLCCQIRLACQACVLSYLLHGFYELSWAGALKCIESCNQRVNRRRINARRIPTWKCSSIFWTSNLIHSFESYFQFSRLNDGSKHSNMSVEIPPCFNCKVVHFCFNESSTTLS